MPRIPIQLPRVLSRVPHSRISCLSSINPPFRPQSRTFINSPAWYKKKDKTKTPSTPDPVTSPASEDPFDLSQLQTGISSAISRLKDDLSKLRAGGRFNTASLENLKVQLSKDVNDPVKLGNLAQVVPKGGRMVTILAAEEEVSWLPWLYLLLC